MKAQVSAWPSVKKNVEQHKGAIRIESESGQGSCFVFTISKSLVVQEERVTELVGVVG